MTYEQIFSAEIKLLSAQRHLANRIAFLTADGLAYPPCAETDAILLISKWLEQLAEERNKKIVRRKTA